MIIDSHTHVIPNLPFLRFYIQGKFKIKFSCEPTKESLLNEMKKASINKALVLNATGKMFQKFLNDLVERNAKSKKLIFVHSFTDHRKITPDIKAIKIHPYLIKERPSNKKFFKLYEKLEKFEIPVIFHTGYVVKGKEYEKPRDFEIISKRFPNLKILLAHFGGGPPRIKDIRRIVKENPRIFLDTSFSHSEKSKTLFFGKEEVECLIDELGSENFIFGSDFPWLKPSEEINFIKNLNIKKRAKNKILGKNAIKFFKIEA